jgi:hypothetical protein
MTFVVFINAWCRTWKKGILSDFLQEACNSAPQPNGSSEEYVLHMDSAVSMQVH